LCDNHAHLLESSFGSGYIQVVEQSPAHAVQGLQQQLGDIKLEIGNMRNEMKELKDEFRKGNNPIVVDNAAVVVVFFAMLVAILVAIVWKK
jgi:hypothetical protein